VFFPISCIILLQNFLELWVSYFTKIRFHNIFDHIKWVWWGVVEPQPSTYHSDKAIFPDASCLNHPLHVRLISTLPSWVYSQELERIPSVILHVIAEYWPTFVSLGQVEQIIHPFNSCGWQVACWVIILCPNGGISSFGDERFREFMHKLCNFS
jgi:hypothetical protein